MRPSALTNSTPIMRSRGEPYRWRRGPLSFVATSPPIVARSPDQGSRGIHWPCAASARFTSASVAPDSIVAVKSPWRCATTLLRRAVESRRPIDSTGGPHWLFVPAPRVSTDSFSRAAPDSVSDTSSAVAGSATNFGITPSTASAGDPSRIRLHPFRKSGALRRMLPIGARHFAAEPGSGEDLSGIAQARRIEGVPQALHGVEVVLGKHFCHVRRLVDADPML